MATIKSTGYSITIGDACFEGINKFLKKNNYTKHIIICDENSLTHCLPILLYNCEALNEAEIIELESGEENKTLETCTQVWGALTDIGADKKSLIVNLGGGIISDLGGFVASTFKRGIDFINIPTTLLAMADASVGGKTGVDFNGIKNHIGTITLPKGIFVNPHFLKTLPQRHLKNGYAEIIKIALISDLTFWNELKKGKLNFSEAVITKAIELKNTIVKQDLNETGIRKALNFGHSIGHAIESSLLNQKQDILHGEAIAAGMILESMIAFEQKHLTKKECDEICQYIHAIYTKIKLSSKTKQLLLEYIKHDKKNEGEALCFSLPNSIGHYAMNCTITPHHVLQAIEKY